MAAWGWKFPPRVGDVRDGQLLNCYHVHKCACDRAMEARLGRCGWTGLDMHLFYLMHSSKVTAKQLAGLKAEAAMMDAMY